MKQKLLKSILLLCALIVGSSSVWADAITYKLQPVTSVTAGGLYVFEQDGYVMNNTVSSKALQTTNSYKTKGLTGTETYVWTLEASSTNFKMKNVSITSSLVYLYSKSDATDVAFSNTGTAWSFNFTDAGTANIQDTGNSNRFLGYTNSTSHAYRAYAATNIDGTTYPHAIKVYQLVEDVTAVESVSLNKSELSLAIGEDETLVATVSPDDATNKNVTWESSDTDVAEVDADGKVSAKATGVATITVTTEDGSKTATCTVTVMAARVDVTGVALNKTATTLLIGSNETLTATVAPADATNKTVIWASDDETIATVADGVVTAVGLGTTTITATTEDGSFTATCDVTVNPIVVTGVTLDKATATLTIGETQTLVASIAPANATNKNVSWTSNNAAVASVSAEGVVTANAVGTATITVTTEDGSFTATCDVTVNASSAKPSLTSVIFNETFAGCDGTGGNDGSWSGSIAATGYNNEGDNTWTMSNAYVANGCVRMGTGSKLGVATTPALALQTDKTYTLTFRAGAWKGKSTNLKVTMTNGTLSASSVTMKSEAFDDFELTISNASADAKITFEGNSTSDSQFFLDDVKITQTLTAVDVTLSATGYASYCSPFALDLTPTEDYAAYAVTATSEESVTFSKIPGKVAANTPFILYNKDNAGQKVSLPVIEDDDAEIAAVSGNMLVGTLAPTYVTTVNGDYTNFGLSGGNFVKINDGTMKANKAYLPILTSNVPAGARLSIVFDEGETTGVREKVTVNSDKFATAPVYNLNGQRVAQPTRGLYIVNGRKVLVP